MPKKGVSNNPNGRPKGAKNKRTLEWEALSEHIVTIHAERFNKILKTQSDEDFVKNYIAVLNYFKPRLSTSQIDGRVATDITQPVRISIDGDEIKLK